MAENRFAKYAGQQPAVVPLPPKAATGYQAAPGGGQAYVPGGNADPRQAGALAGAEAGARANAALPAQRAEIQARLAAALLEDKIKRDREAAAKSRETRQLDPQKLANIRAVQSQIDRLNYLYKNGPGKTKGMAGWLDYLPTPKNGQFDSAAAGLGEVGLAAFRVPGVGGQSDAELRAFVDANRPSSWNYDAKSQEKVRNLQNRLDQTYRAYGIKRQGSGKEIDFNDLGD